MQLNMVCFLGKGFRVQEAHPHQKCTDHPSPGYKTSTCTCLINVGHRSLSKCVEKIKGYFSIISKALLLVSCMQYGIHFTEEFNLMTEKKCKLSQVQKNMVAQSVSI